MAAVDVAGSNNPSDETSTHSRWSDLPPELAGLVLDRLPSNDDRVRFSSVCRYWRYGLRQWSSPAPAPPLRPWLNLMDSERTFQSVGSGKLHTRMAGIPDSGICIASFDSWLLFFKSGNYRFPYSLLNPLAGAVLTLPANYHGVGRGFFGRLSMHNVIVCSSDLVVANVETEDRPAIACCRPGSSSWSARLYAAGREATWHYYRYQGIAFRHGKVYGLNSRGELFVHDVITSDAAEDIPTTLSPARKLIKAVFHNAKLYLVAMASSGKLLMVRRTAMMTIPLTFRLRVFEADLRARRWKKMPRLDDDDEVMFVSDTFSKTVSAARHGGYDLRRNHIYCMDYVTWPRKSIRCGRYDLSNDTFHVMLPSDHTPDQLSASWFFPRA